MTAKVSRKVLWHEYDKNSTLIFFLFEVLKTRIARIVHGSHMPGFVRYGHIYMPPTVCRVCKCKDKNSLK